MKELMLELLTFEPYERLISGEEDYIRSILSGWYLQPKSMFHDLFSGFYHYVQNEKFKDTKDVERIKRLAWLRHWKDTYIQGKRDHYPLLFKKMFFYIIVRWKIVDNKFTDKKFVEMLDLHENLTRKWNLSMEFRKYAEVDTYTAIKSYRSGIKKPYIVSTIKKLYYEAGRQVIREDDDNAKRQVRKGEKRQVRKAMTIRELPRFVDVFAGTASVAASMGASKGFPPPIINDYDPVMVCFVWAFTYCQRELRKRIAEFHNYLMTKDFESTDWSHNADAYGETIDPKSLLTNPKIWDDAGVKSRLMEFFGYSEADIAEGRRLAQRHQELVMRIRSSYIDIKKILDLCDRENLRKEISFDESLKDMSKEQVKKILKYAFAMYYFYSFPPFGKNGNVYEETIVDACSYYSFLSRMQKDKNAVKTDLDAVKRLKDVSRKNKADKAETLSELQLKASLLTLESTGKFSKHLRRATFCCKDFKEILQDDSSQDASSNKKIYYLDSPYFLTVGYDVSFYDDAHIDMLNILRGARFSWIFSMQYNQSKRDKCTISFDEAVRKNQPHIIKNYGAYYRGFFAPFQLDADQRAYVVPDAAMEDEENLKRLKKLYIILFDFDEVKKKWPEMKTETREMLVVNFNCLPAIPLHYPGVVLPFEEFLKYADADTPYKDIVRAAKDWRKDNIERMYADKAPV